MDDKPEIAFNWSTPRPENQETAHWNWSLILFATGWLGLIYSALAIVPACLSGVNPSWVNWLIPLLIMGSAAVASGFAQLDQKWALFPSLFFFVGMFVFPALLICLTK